MTSSEPGHATRSAAGRTDDATGAALSDLLGVDVADVYRAGRLAGRLRRDGDDVVFDYDSSYLADPEAPAVAVTLPKTDEPARASAGAAPPFFAGLLPEGARLQAVTAGVHTSADDHLTLLLVVGADAIGDVQVLPAGVPPADPPTLLDAAAPGVDDFAAVFARAISTDPAQLDRVSLPGIQVKVSAAMMSTPSAPRQVRRSSSSTPTVGRTWWPRSTSSSRWPPPAACPSPTTICCTTAVVAPVCSSRVRPRRHT